MSLRLKAAGLTSLKGVLAYISFLGEEVSAYFSMQNGFTQTVFWFAIQRYFVRYNPFILCRSVQGAQPGTAWLGLMTWPATHWQIWWAVLSDDYFCCKWNEMFGGDGPRSSPSVSTLLGNFGGIFVFLQIRRVTLWVSTQCRHNISDITVCRDNPDIREMLVFHFWDGWMFSWIILLVDCSYSP